MPTLKSNNPKILACDPSFTAWGWVVMQNHIRIDSGCIKTTKESKKRRIREGDDKVRRVTEIVSVLLDLIEKYDIQFIVTELPHGSQNAAGAVMIGVVIGIFQTIVQSMGVPVEWYSENDAKKALVGRNSVSKAEVIAAVEETFEDKLVGPKYVREAVADAMAIYNAAQKNSPTLKIVLRNILNRTQNESNR
jgi:Holliday junction resolvasome RuvABC endonuclease subunit